MTLLDLSTGAPTCPQCRTSMGVREAPFGARFGGARNMSLEWFCPDSRCEFNRGVLPQQRLGEE